MLIPYNTDAPLYHPPFATVGLIIVNVLLFLPVFMHPDPYGLESEAWQEAIAESGDEELVLDDTDMDIEFDEEDIPEFDENGQPISQAERDVYLKQLEALQKEHSVPAGEAKPVAADSGSSRATIWRLMTLEYGKFRPWQWLTANYMHGGLFHLIGNMFVLWGFGLVVEGKVGWWRFLLIYNAIGIIGLAIIQMVMLFADNGVGLGASLAIFGILVIALVWAPANEMQCVFMAGIRPIVFESSIMSIAVWSVLLQLAVSMVQIYSMAESGFGVRVTGEIAHLIGGAFGCAVGIVMVKRRLVDCENWDVFSVWSGKNIRTGSEDREEVAQQLEKIKKLEQKRLTPATETVGSMPSVDQRETLIAEFRSQVAAGRPLDAWTTFCRGQQQYFDWHVPEPDFIAYVSALRKQQLWEYVVGAAQEYLMRYSEREIAVRFALAQVLVQQLDRPRDAWKVLNELNPGLLSETDKATFDKLRLACKKRVAAANAPKSNEGKG